MPGNSEEILLFKLNVTMGLLGFQKDLDCFVPLNKAALPESLLYLDVAGNKIAFAFDWKSPNISVSFNKSVDLAWTRFELLLQEITSRVNEWTQQADATSVTETEDQAPKARIIKARDILRDLRLGLDGDAILGKYKISIDTIEDVLVKLGKQGLVLPDEVVAFKSRLSEVQVKEYMCLKCNQIQFAKLNCCPYCGGKMRGITREYDRESRPAEPLEQRA
jgi:hypothetical protein